MDVTFVGRRIDTNEPVSGYYFVSPLTDENSGAPPETGWFFLTGEKRHCIATKEGVVYVVHEDSIFCSIINKINN